jgi:hypothetical protein
LPSLSNNPCTANGSPIFWYLPFDTIIQWFLLGF